MRNSSAAIVLVSLLHLDAAAAQEIDASVLSTRPRMAAPAARPPRQGSFMSGTVGRTLATNGTDPFASVGRGFDPVTGEVLDIVCVEGTEPDHELGGGSIIRTDLKIVSDDRSHAAASGSSLGFSAMIKAVSVGFGTSSSSASSFNSVEQFARIYSRIATVGVERRNVRWSKEASRLLKNDLRKFLDQCGTRYVRGVYSGHLLDQTAHFKLNANAHSASDATTLSIGVANLFSASAAFSDADADYKRIATVELTSQNRGALAIPPAPAAAPPSASPDPAGRTALVAAPRTADGGATPSDPQKGPTSGAGSSSSASAGGSAPASPLATLVAWYNGGFAAAVAAADKSKAVPLYVVTQRYRGKLGLDGADRIPSWDDDLMQLVLARSEDYDDLVTALADIRFALGDGTYAKLAAFYKDDEKTATDKQTAGSKMLADFRAAVKECQALLVAGKEAVPDTTKPGASVSAVTACQRRIDATLTPEKVAAVKLKRKFDAGGVQPPPGPGT